MKSLFTIFLLSLLSLTTYAQEDFRENKHYKKMSAYYQKGEYDKAVEEMRVVQNEYEQVPKVWEIAIKLHFERYAKAPESNDQALAEQLINAMKEVDKNKKGSNKIVLNISSPKELYFNSLVNTCREANLKLRDGVSSMYIRILLVDKEVDKDVPKEAYAFQQEAEEHFQKKNFNKALECYEKAIQAYPNFYKATLYKGDTYYHLKDYKNAVIYYKKAEAMAPDLLEPVKYLTDAYARDELYDDAMNSCIRGITLYPDVSMFAKLYDIADAKGKRAVDPWVKRKCYPNKSLRTSVPATDPDWLVYQKAKEKIQPFCDSTGAITVKNDLTTQRYMETYCWEEMLKSTTDKQFDFAKRMQQEGFLDCYVFITMYHYDIHEQYKQFTFNNDQRIKTYITKYLITQ